MAARVSVLLGLLVAAEAAGQYAAPVAQDYSAVVGGDDYDILTYVVGTDGIVTACVQQKAPDGTDPAGYGSDYIVGGHFPAAGIDVGYDGCDQNMWFFGSSSITAASPTALYFVSPVNTYVIQSFDLTGSTPPTSISNIAGSFSITDYVNQPGASARFGAINAIALSPDGAVLYIAEYGKRIRYVMTDTYVVGTLTGSTQPIPASGSLDGLPSVALFYNIMSIAASSSLLYVIDETSLSSSPSSSIPRKLRTVVLTGPSAGTVSTYFTSNASTLVSNSGATTWTSPFCVDGSTASTAVFNSFSSVAVDSTSTVWLTDVEKFCGSTVSMSLRSILPSGVINTVSFPAIIIPAVAASTGFLPRISAGGSTIAFLTPAISTTTPESLYVLSADSPLVIVPAGYYNDPSTSTLSGFAFAVACPGGTWGGGGSTSSSCSGLCAPGYACPAGSTTATATACAAGFYTSGGQGVCSKCPPGTFGDGTLGGRNSPACSGQCAAGYKCPSGSSVPVACAAGTYSLAGSGSCTACSGTYGDGSLGGRNTSACSGPCPAGYACPAGTISTAATPMFTALKLYASLYTSEASSFLTPIATVDATSTACVGPFSYPFASEKYVKVTAQSSTSATVTFYSSTDSSCTGSAAFTLSSISLLLTAAPSSSTLVASSTSGTENGFGYFINPMAVPCSAGSYSLAGSGSCTPCPAGRFGDGSPEGRNSPSCSGPCAPGSYCGLGTSLETMSNQKCNSGTYSTGGATTCSNCPVGTYGNRTGLTTAACSGTCASLPLGYTCMAIYDNPNGKGLEIVSSALQEGFKFPRLCPVGMYCSSPTAKPLPCVAGSYVCAWDTSSFDSVDECTWPVDISGFKTTSLMALRRSSESYFCDTPMNSNQYQDNNGQLYKSLSTSSRPCRSSNNGYSTLYAVQGFSNPQCSGSCLPGASCPLFSTGPSNAGPYGPITNKGGLIETSGSPSSSIGILTETPCPLGYYCPGNFNPPLPCAAGSYNPIGNRTSCLLCAAGTYQSLSGSPFCARQLRADITKSASSSLTPTHPKIGRAHV